MKFLILLLFITPAHAYECSLQTEFYRTLPVFLGTQGTLELTTENIITLNNRGTGVQTETKGNTVRYFYPAQSFETHILKTTLPNGDVSLTTAPKYFNCNVRHALLRKNKIVSLSYCSVDGCRHITPEVCVALKNKFTEDKLAADKSITETISMTEDQVKARSSALHKESSILSREYQRLSEAAPRVLGASLSDYTPEEDNKIQGLLKLGAVLASETQYCRWLEKNNLFWKVEERPSEYLKKPN